MLDDYNGYLNALNERQITTHREALKYFNVRYASFIQNLPRECLLPGCVLAKHGFHFDSNTDTIRCIECSFHSDPVNHNDSLVDILTRHFQFSRNCEQVKQSLKSIMIDEDDDGGGDEDADDDADLVPTTACTTATEFELLDNSMAASESLDANNNNEDSFRFTKFISLESRLKTFENVKMLIDRDKLAENGIYLVPKDNPTAAASSQPLDTRRPEMTQIEKVAQSIQFLYHVKCAFCAYECLLFRNSLLNTFYKSPFDEHNEKFGSKCPIFADTYHADESEAAAAAVATSTEPNSLDWLQVLYEFESSGLPEDTELEKHSFPLSLDATLEIKSMPKILDYLMACNAESKATAAAPIYRSPTSQLVTGPSAAPNLVYVPKSSSVAASGGPGVGINALTTTSDYNQLQAILTQTNNLITGKAYSPAFSQYQARIDTFRDWPATLSQQPADLARAGFYYFGIKDMVKCFFCNGGLKNWDHNDDPYEDHVRWFPKCQYVRQLMGVEYIESVREKFRNDESGFTSAETEPGGGEQTTLAATNKQGEAALCRINGKQNPACVTGGKKRSTSPRSLNSRLDTLIIRKILDNGILTRDSIKLSFDMKLSAMIAPESNYSNSYHYNNNNLVTGNGVYADDFKSAIELAAFAYDLDRAKKSRGDLVASISDLVICNLNQRLSPVNVREFFRVKYGLYAAHVRILKQADGSKTVCLLSLKPEDKSHVDEITRDLEKDSAKSYLNDKTNLLVFKTNWFEIEEKAKRSIGKEQFSLAPAQSAVTAATAAQTAQSPAVNAKLNEAAKREVANKQQAEKEKSLDALKVESGAPREGKEELALIEENERLKNERLCVICLSKDKNVLFLPCAHLAACLECSLSLQNCPLCRSDIQARIRTFG